MSAGARDGFDGFDPDTGEFREPAPPPKPRVEYPSRASLRKQARKGGSATTPASPPAATPAPPPAARAAEIDLRGDSGADRSIDLDATGSVNRIAFGDDATGTLSRVPETDAMSTYRRFPAGDAPASYRRAASDDSGTFSRLPASDDTGSLAWIPADDDTGALARGPADDETSTFSRVPADDDTSLFVPSPSRSGPSPRPGDSGARTATDDASGLTVQTDVTGRLALPPGSGARSFAGPPTTPAGPATGSFSPAPPAGPVTPAAPVTPATGSFRALPVGPGGPVGPPPSASEDVPERSGPSPIPRAVAAVVALAGILLVAGGVLQSTMWKPRTTITASLADAPSQPVVVSAPGLLGLNGTRVQVTASGASNKPVFVGIGRASDVMAYLGSTKRETVTGENGDGVLVARNEGTRTDLPDPGSVDVWVLSQRAPGAAGVSWPNVSGQYVVMAATDGSGAAPARLTFTWTGAKPHSLGAALIAIGAVFVVCGLVLLIMLISRARLERLE